MLNESIAQTTFQATNEVNGQFKQYLGKWLVLYFYPKDATPGCTTEGENFSEHYDAFKHACAEIFGISTDSLASHERFKQKQGFPFELISDAEEALCQQFEVIKMKNMFGKQVRGIERSTFVINPEGICVKVWRKVKVEGHVEEVLAYLQAQLA